MDTPALHASMLQPTGLTPLPGVGEGLSFTPGTNMAIADFADTQSVNATTPHVPKNPARERHERLKEVAEKLKRRVAGRGFTRDTLQRLALIHGFASLLQDNRLTIAGSSYVDLEITFDASGLEQVTDVSLKINASKPLEHASEVLKQNLTINKSHLPWQDVTDFSSNLAYLSRLEAADTAGNCFEAVDNLYDVFQRIWSGEKKRKKWRSDAHHLCRSNVGMPEKDVDGRLGVRTTYWYGGSSLSSLKDPSDRSKPIFHTAQFAVATGPPAISASQTWLGEDAFTSSNQAADIFQDTAADRPAWKDLDPRPDAAAGNSDAMQVEQIKKELERGLNMHFTCDFNHEIYLPANVAQSLNSAVHMVDLNQRKLIAPRHLIQPDINLQSDTRWSRDQSIFSRSGEHQNWKYTYMIYATNNTWLHPVSRLRFAHPKQYADALPVLRQYALANGLLRSLIPNSAQSAGMSTPKPHSNGHALPHRPREPQIRTKHVKRSNRKPDIASLLVKPDNELPIDVQFDISDRAHFRLRLPTPKSLSHLKSKPGLEVMIEILLNGEIDVKIHGVEVQNKDALHRKLGKVVRKCEDIGTSVAWCIRELEGMGDKENVKDDLNEMKDDSS